MMGKREFLAEVLPHAAMVEEKTGVLARFLIAQAALETGWGKHLPRLPDGTSSFNFFGIKGFPKSWKGPVAEAMTTEYEDGKRVRKPQPFRAYASPQECFEDYIRVILSAPRYFKAMSVRSNLQLFAAELQAAGYATDPRYAEKILKIAEGI